MSSTAETGAGTPPAELRRSESAAAESSAPLALSDSLQVVVGILLLAFVVVATWNAWEYPTSLGYDALANIKYAHDLIHGGHIPSQAEGGEYYTPPGFYALAGAAMWVGEWLGLHHPERMAQQLNVFIVLATAFLLLYLGKLLFPRRPAVRVAALAFFIFVPVVPKVTAMFHPEPLNMLVSMSAVTLATWMIRYRRYGPRELVALAALLAVGQVVRASSMFTLIAVGLAVAIALLVDRVDRRAAVRALTIGVAALVVLVSPWYVRQAIRYHTAAPINVVPGFAQQMLHPGDSIVSQEGGLRHYFGLPLLELYRWPTRPHFINKAIPTTYAETWDDWLGWWAWVPDRQPSGHTLQVLRQQILIGVIPTLLAVGGWVSLLLASRRRRELLPVALLPPVAVAGYLYRSYASASPDGDVLKAAYLLITAPMWALAFGVAFEWIARNVWARVALLSLLAVFAVLELRFLVWGMRAGKALF